MLQDVELWHLIVDLILLDVEPWYLIVDLIALETDAESPTAG